MRGAEEKTMFGNREQKKTWDMGRNQFISGEQGNLYPLEGP